VCEGNKKLFYFLLVWKHNGMLCVKTGDLTFQMWYIIAGIPYNFVTDYQIPQYANFPTFPILLFLPSKYSPFHPFNKLSFHVLLHSWYVNNMYKQELSFAAVTCEKRKKHTTLHLAVTYILRNQDEVISKI